MRSSLSLLFILLSFTRIFADQCAVFDLEGAKAAVSFFDGNRDVVLWCACCEGDKKEYVHIDEVYFQPGRIVTDMFEVVIKGRDENGVAVNTDIDLAYIHVLRDGRAICAGTELECGCDPCTEPFKFSTPDIKPTVQEEWNFGAIEIYEPAPYSGYSRVGFPADESSLIQVRVNEKWASSIGFLPESEVIIAGGGYFDENTGLGMINMKTGKMYARLPGHKEHVQSLAMSHQLKMFITGDNSGKIIAWNEFGKKKYQIDEHSDWVEGLAASADGKYFASASRDKKVCVWNAADGKLLRRFRVDFEIASSIAISPDNRMLAAGGIGVDNEVYLIDLFTGEISRRLDLHTRWSKDLAFSPDGRLLVSAGDCDNNVVVYDLESNSIAETIESPYGCVEAVAIDPSGRYIAIASLWGILVHDMDSGTVVFKAKTHDFPAEDIVFSPEGKYLASAGRDGEAHVWTLSLIK